MVFGHNGHHGQRVVTVVIREEKCHVRVNVIFLSMAGSHVKALANQKKNVILNVGLVRVRKLPLFTTKFCVLISFCYHSELVYKSGNIYVYNNKEKFDNNVP